MGIYTSAILLSLVSISLSFAISGTSDRSTQVLSSTNSQQFVSVHRNISDQSPHRGSGRRELTS